jgi:M6 family metalloprotease-like protein
MKNIQARLIPVLVLLFAAILSAPCAAGFDDQFIEPHDIGQNKVPHMGYSRVLVIPVVIDELGDPALSGWEAFFRNDLEAMTFKNFWHVNSVARYEVDTTLLEPVHYAKCPLPTDTFPGCKVPRGDVKALQPGIDFIKDLLTRVQKEQGVNFADYDINGPDYTADGWVDGILVMTNADFTGIALPVSFFKNMKLDGTKIGAVAFAALDDHPVIPIHEFGHLLGFGDLYHEHKRDRGLYLSLMGEYDRGIPLIDAYSRIKIGWADVVEAEGAPQEFRLAPAETSGQVLRIGGDSEFYLVENRGPGKFFDKGLSGRGLAVYHVDESTRPEPGKWTFIQLVIDCLNCNEWHPLAMNMPPDGRFRIQRGELPVQPGELLFGTGDKLMPDYMFQNVLTEYRYSLNSNWYSGEPSDIAIFDIDNRTHLPAITVKAGIE